MYILCCSLDFFDGYSWINKPWISNLKNTAKISHLLYIDDLVVYEKSALVSLPNTVRIFSNAIAMAFGSGKCATLIITQGIALQTEGINLPNKNIKGLNIDKTYKYLGILQASDIKYTQIKMRTSIEYNKSVQKILTSKWNGGNTIKIINSFVEPVVRNITGIID